MGYTAVKGGLDAIEAAEELIQSLPTDPDEPALELRQLRHQLAAAVDKVVGEGGVYAPDLAAQAIRQTEGDLFEAAFVLRAYRSTLPRLGYAEPVEGKTMRLRRRISSAFRDIPGGQLLGRTRDYTQRLLDFASRVQITRARSSGQVAAEPSAPKMGDVLRRMGVLPAAEPAPDLTRESMRFPVSRPAWLQALARGESGALVCLAYSSLRGYGGRADHATIAELRVGELPLRVLHPLTGEPLTIGWFTATEVEMVGGEHSTSHKHAAYSLSYGLVFGQHERKAIAMANLDIAVERDAGRTSLEQSVLMTTDALESSGFLEHLKLPHYVTFRSMTDRKLAMRSMSRSSEETNE